MLNIQQSGMMSIHLPLIQWPSVTSILDNVRVRVLSFLRRSAKLIIGFSGMVGILSNINTSFDVVGIDASLIASLGQFLAPYFSFMGLGADLWQPVVALLAGVVAKEIVLTTLNSLYHLSLVGEQSFWIEIADVFVQLYQRFIALFGFTSAEEIVTPLQQFLPQEAALAYMVFVLLYFPCISTLVVLQQECGTKWAMLSFLITTVLSVWAAKVVYSGFGLETLVLLGSMILAIILRNAYDAFSGEKTVFSS